MITLEATNQYLQKRLLWLFYNILFAALTIQTLLQYFIVKSVLNLFILKKLTSKSSRRTRPTLQICLRIIGSSHKTADLEEPKFPQAY